MGYAARNNRRKRLETLKLPEKTRIVLGELYKAQIAATEKFQLAASVALDFLGLDPNGKHQINFDTGVVTPETAPAPSAEPTPIRPNEEAAG